MNKSGVFHKQKSLLFIIIIAFGAFASRKPVTPVPFIYPQNWPAPVYDFQKNPLTQESIQLGRRLFYDPIISRDSTISCSSCHLSFTAFTHVDHALSHGIGDSIGTRNSPVLINLAWSTAFMWDGAINHLEVQALAPISHPAEMGSDINTVVKKLQASPEYRGLFRLAYGDERITGERVLKALAQFQLTFVSADSKYDRVMRHDTATAFTAQELKGYELFKKHCNHCHTEPLFTSGGYANNGLPQDSILQDIGRMWITGNPKDSLLFKIPTLRNIEFSFPYMHDGRFKKLSQVMKHYTSGITPSPTLAPELGKGISLTPDERVDITAFLLTLSDRNFLFNKEIGYPK